jgi:hypothetical protein
MILADPSQLAVTRCSPSGLKATSLTSRGCSMLKSFSPVAAWALYVDVEGGEIATPMRVADHEGAQERARALRREIVGWGIILASEPLEGKGA